MVSSGYLSILYSIGKNPLEYWSKQCSQTGRIRRTLDGDLFEKVVELQDLEESSNGNTFISCPASSQQLLDIRLPFLIIIMKNMNVECRFRIQIIDANDIRHHFYFCNEGFEKNSRIRLPIIGRVVLKLESGWNRVEIDLEKLTQRAFNSQYKATQRLAICANCRLRRVYFVDRHYANMEISPALCQAFFHYYMMKWGIHLPKKTSQTDESYSDVRMAEPATGQANKDIYDQVNHYQFLRGIRLKSGRLINDFFRRKNRRLSNTLNVRSKSRLMLFTVPSLRGEEMLAAATRNNAIRKSKTRCVSDASHCTTLTKNRTNSKGDGPENVIAKFSGQNQVEVDQYQRKKRNAYVTLDADWHSQYHPEEPSRMNSLVTPVPDQKRIQKPQKQDKFSLKNCKGSSNGVKCSLVIRTLVSDKRAVKTTASNAKPKENASFHDAVKSLKGTLNVIRGTSSFQEPSIRNKTRVKMMNEEKQQHASYLETNFIRERKNLQNSQPRAIVEGFHGVLNNKKDLGSVSCNKNCSKLSKESKILTAQECGGRSVSPFSLEIKSSKREKGRSGSFIRGTQKIL